MLVEKNKVGLLIHKNLILKKIDLSSADSQRETTLLAYLPKNSFGLINLENYE